jgi:amino-acid N-acetyltransferase
LNSDAVAVEVARSLRAVKLIYLTRGPGVMRGPELLRQLSVEEAETILRKQRGELNEAVSKLEQAVKAARGGVERVHIIDGREQEGLLAEVFSNEGIGTLIHANEYQAIRQAQKRDVRAIYNLIRGGMETDELMQRTRAEVERQIDDFFVFEVDRNPVACGAVHLYPAEQKAEMACVYVDDRHANLGIGGKLMNFAEARARAAGAVEFFCLSTQAFNYFMQKGGFRPGSPDDLPPGRRQAYERSGRRSRVLIKRLDGS